MKTRTGFVSNSSSSSFIVIEGNNLETTYSENIIGRVGETEFGWGPDELNDFYSKANWCILISNNDEELDMLKDVITKHLGEVEFDFEYTNEHGYIDHQSGRNENPDNAEMFESEEKLEQFLFSDESKIVLANDNETDFSWY